jgi:hypothetical protein
MTPTIPDLWPESFGEPPLLTPVAILKQQGILLGQNTGNLVYGEVQSRGLPSGEFMHVLDITAPLLAFRQPTAVVLHKVELYPVRVGKAKPGDIRNQFGVPEVESELQLVGSPEEFLTVLKSILQSEATLKLIRSLIAQCAEPTPVES